MSLELLLWIVAISGLSPRLEKPLYGLLYGPEKKPPVFTVFGPLWGRGSTLVNTGGAQLYKRDVLFQIALLLYPSAFSPLE